MPPDPKPIKPHRADRDEWSMLRSAIMKPGVRCFCGCGRMANSLHHLVGRDQGGGDEFANLVPLAGSGTTLCHGAYQFKQRTWDERRQVYVEPDAVARGIRKHMNVAHVRYVSHRKGEWWLDKNYPS